MMNEIEIEARIAAMEVREAGFARKHLAATSRRTITIWATPQYC